MRTDQPTKPYIVEPISNGLLIDREGQDSYIIVTTIYELFLKKCISVGLIIDKIFGVNHGQWSKSLNFV